MPNKIKDDLLVVDEKSYPYIFEQNVTIKLRSFEGLVRCNIYRPKTDTPVPVILTYGPYGKDIPYKESVTRRYKWPPELLTRRQLFCEVLCRNQPQASVSTFLI